MRTLTYIFVALLGCVLMAAPLLAQNPTGTITGRVTHQDGPLPGVTVTADSPSMQGQKVAVTGGSGEYIFRFLPAGDYTITFALDGYHDPRVCRSWSRSPRPRPSTQRCTSRRSSEEIVVTGNYETVSVGTQSNVTMQQDLIEAAAGRPDHRVRASCWHRVTSTTGPSDAVTISGAQSYENLFLVNGVVVNENIRGDADRPVHRGRGRGDHGHRRRASRPSTAVSLAAWSTWSPSPAATSSPVPSAPA